MHRTTALLLWAALWLPLGGIVYFLGLLMDVHFGWILAATISLAAGLGIWIFKRTPMNATPRLDKRMGMLLLLGIACLAAACAFLSRRYGDWDAALIWNLHARHLASGKGWRAIYEAGASGNAAYPLGLPSSIALLWRVLGTQSQTVPFLLALLPTVGIPVVIFLEGARTKLWIGAAVLALFGLHRYYLALGLDQYADIQVAWLWPLAAVCMNGAEASRQKSGWVAAGLLLGAMCWTKWDGVLLACCLLISHTRQFLRRPRALWLMLLGAAPFMLAIGLFLQTGPPRAPLLTDLGGIAARAADGERYRIIASAFAQEAIGRHWPLVLLLIATPMFWKRHVSTASRRLYTAVVAAMAGYALVYLLLVSTDLGWNLEFSLPRLLLQIYPLAVFAAALAASVPERQHTLR